MKKCINCNNQNRDTDKYCRMCGCKIRNNIYYILYKIITIILVIGIIFMVALFIASYYITKGN